MAEKQIPKQVQEMILRAIADGKGGPQPAVMQPPRPPPQPTAAPSHGPVDIVVKCHQATGDAMLMHSAIREVKRAYGHRFRFAVDCNFPELFLHSPWLTRVSELYNPIVIEAGQDWSW